MINSKCCNRPTKSYRIILYFGRRLLGFGGVPVSLARNSAAAANARAAPPTPFLFARPSVPVFAARSAAIIRDFVQNGFALRSVIATIFFLTLLPTANNLNTIKWHYSVAIGLLESVN